MSAPTDPSRHRPSDDAMTRSEERLRVGTAGRVVERLRITRRVITEEVTLTVPVSREELHIEHLPVSGDGAPGASTAGAPRELVVELRAEEPVVQKRVVPLERVRITTEVITEAVPISDTVRHEEIAVEQLGPTAPPPRA